MRIPEEIRAYCTSKFGEVHSFSLASGGCINNGGKLTTDAGVFFIKWNSSSRFPQMFDKESLGLKLLAQTNAVTIPQVVEVYNGNELSCIILEYLDSRPPLADYWTIFGRSLAQVHSATAEQYGLDHDNYMGSLRQFNSCQSDWIEFFIEQRLNSQLKLAIDHEKMDQSHVGKFDTLYRRLPTLLVIEPPRLIHGDLWSGNIMVDASGRPAMIDPAVSFANREMDIGMIRLFDGPPTEFYRAYQEALPMAPGWEERTDLYNLYPLLVHVNLFGSGYLGQTMQIVEKYM